MWQSHLIHYRPEIIQFWLTLRVRDVVSMSRTVFRLDAPPHVRTAQAVRPEAAPGMALCERLIIALWRLAREYLSGRRFGV